MLRLKYLGKNIKKFRKIKGYSQKHLAEKVDLSREYITRIENGQEFVSLKKLFVLADVLGVKFSELTNLD